jgi:hypothetical protein
MSNRVRPKDTPLVEPASGARCPTCSSRLRTGTNQEGVVVETCPHGCIESRPIPRRKPGCPECGSAAWDAEQGCRDCGYAWTVRASNWDGTVYYWQPAGWSRGHEVKS